MRVTSVAEWREFVGHGARTGTLATVRADGSPHAVPVWFVLDGDDVVLTTWHTSVKARNLRRDPRAVPCVEDSRLPYSFVMIEGGVRIGDDPAELRERATRIATRYLGSELGAQYGARNGVEGDLLVRLTRPGWSRRPPSPSPRAGPEPPDGAGQREPRSGVSRWTAPTRRGPLVMCTSSR